MATYDYRFLDTGETVEVTRSMKLPPLTEIDGRAVEVVISGGHGGYVNPFDNKYPYVSNRLPRNLDGCEVNSKGQPIIESKKHEQRIMGAHGYTRD